LPWGHIRVLVDKLDEPDARDWYAGAGLAGGRSHNLPLSLAPRCRLRAISTVARTGK